MNTTITPNEAAGVAQFMQMTLTSLKNPTVERHYWALKATVAEAMYEVTKEKSLRDMYTADDRKAIKALVAEMKHNAVIGAPVPEADMPLAVAKFDAMNLRKQIEAEQA